MMPSLKALRLADGRADPEQFVADPFANRVQRFVLHLYRRGRRILVFDTPIHRIEIDRPTESINQ
jgi:hypothetical protein